MDRSPVRIISLFLLAILINHIFLATNARVISSTSSVDELAACPPTDEISTTLIAGGPPAGGPPSEAGGPPAGGPPFKAGGPPSDFTGVQTTSVSIDPTNVHDSGKPTDEFAACPPTEN
ncbi:hypothetical protein POM88_005712 [Heracleum sosnowskyi]|uniref:Uncharacterized protein n=1 Tax=Heracleum sosnowskyi TaxID=360622 RepID=A0AAD8J404_9APIA|nr:hypothetical protein POM88_005709 [Heracleum sosnowskyi]KAK1395849.1 hypothetical protein POM88_005712 [Heracleum sosnowskyi]